MPRTKGHTLILTGILLAFMVGRSQTNVYHSFPDSNAVWRVNYWEFCSFYNVNAYSNYQYTIGGDTTIGTYTYKKIYQSGMFSTCTNTLSTYNYFYRGGLRQDSVNKKVYFKESYSSCPDTLIYDFGKQIGDTLEYISCTTGFSVTITSIDSILVGNNYHKQFHLSNNYGPLVYTIIEGVGATSGLLEPVSSAPHFAYNLSCFSHYNDVYPSTATSCPLINSIHELGLPNDRTKVVPNPFDQFATIEFQNINNENCTLTVYDICGQIVRNVTDISTDKLIFTRHNLKAGLYFFVLRSIDRVISTGKLSVE